MVRDSFASLHKYLAPIRVDKNAENSKNEFPKIRKKPVLDQIPS